MEDSELRGLLQGLGAKVDQVLRKQSAVEVRLATIEVETRKTAHKISALQHATSENHTDTQRKLDDIRMRLWMVEDSPERS